MVTMNQNILEDYAEVPPLGLMLSKNLSWARYIYVTYPLNRGSDCHLSEFSSRWHTERKKELNKIQL